MSGPYLWNRYLQRLQIECAAWSCGLISHCCLPSHSLRYWTKVRGITPRSHTGRPRTCLVVIIIVIIIIIIIVTLPPLERYLNWEHDPAPPSTRYHGDLSSHAPSESQEYTPPQDASRKLPRKLRPHQRREKQPRSTTNDNSAFWKTGTGSRTANRNSAFHGTGSATRPRSTANDNLAFPEAGSATRLRLTANDNSAFPGAGN